MHIREATHEDIRTVYPEGSMPSHKSWIVEEDGSAICLGGFYRFQNRWWAFFEVIDKAKLEKHKIHIIRKVRRELGEHIKGPVYALVNMEHERPVKWLLTLGFRPILRPGLFRRD